MSPQDAAMPARAFLRSEFDRPKVRSRVREDIETDPKTRGFYFQHAHGMPVQRIEQVTVSAVIVAAAAGASARVAAVLGRLIAVASGAGEEREPLPGPDSAGSVDTESPKP